MNRLATLGGVLAATLSVGLAISAIAGAEEFGNPVVLPEPTESKPLTFTSTSGAIELDVMGIPLVCLSGSTSGEFKSKRLGKATIVFKACEAKSPPVGCRTPGSAKGTISILGADLHLVAYKEGEALRAALVMTMPASTKIECTFGSYEWIGSVFAPLTGIAGETTTAKFSFGAGECELDKEFCFEGAIHRKFKLEAAGGSSLEIGREDSVTFGEKIKIDY